MKRFFVLVVIAASFATSSVRADTAAHHVLSMNACVDQFLIALADKDQIAALSSYARNKMLSYYAKDAENYPITSGSVEEILALNPDLIISGPIPPQLAAAEIQKRGFRIVEIESAESYEAIRAQIGRIADLLGHQDRGEALIAKMDAELAAIPAPPAPLPEAAYYQRRGFLTGTGTLMDEIMRRAGFTNIATRLGRSSVTSMPLEVIVQTHPDYLIMEADADAVPDNGTALLSHPALTKAVPAARQLFVPLAMTVCGGPFFPEAVKRLADQRR